MEENTNYNYAQTTQHLVKEQGSDLEKLLQENLRYNRAIYEDTQKIRRYMFWRMILNVVWLIIILLPIIFALIYLPPAIGSIFSGYQSLLGESQGTFDLLNQLNQLK